MGDALGVNGVVWKWCGSDGLIDKLLDVLLLRELFAYFEVGSTDYVMTEKEKMLAGVVYSAIDEQFSVGRRFFANFHLTILDEARVTIGDDCFIGPNVSIYTACHSTDPVERNSRREWAEPVTIGDNVWIGGSVTILPGVTIGNNVTIGAGSVVTKDIPDGVVAVGNPCRVVRNV